MAENSAFWYGSTLGDAASATGWHGKYSYLNFSDIHSKLLANDDNQGFVIPDYGDNLLVQATGGLSVYVETGAALVRGFIYENTAQNTLTVTANASGNPRIDRVVLRISFAAQTIRAAVLAGTPGAAPALPTLTQDSATYEISLAYVWVADGAASIADTDIHDEREFALTYSSANDFFGAENQVYNSEFLAFGPLNGDLATNNPEGWLEVNAPASITSATKPSQMIRGRAVEITTNGASEGLSQAFQVKASVVYAIKLLTWVTSGDVGSIVITTDSAAPGTITRYTRRVEEWIEEIIYYTTENDATTMTINILGLNNGDVIRYGQVLAVEGYYPGPFREIHEPIMFIDNFTDANWNFDGYSTGTTTIDLTADFGGFVLPGTKALFCLIYITDAGAAPTSINLRPYGFSVDHATKMLNANNLDNAGCGWVSLDSTPRFDIYVEASGALSGVCLVTILGIHT